MCSADLNLLSLCDACAMGAPGRKKLSHVNWWENLAGNLNNGNCGATYSDKLLANGKHLPTFDRCTGPLSEWGKALLTSIIQLSIRRIWFFFILMENLWFVTAHTKLRDNCFHMVHFLAMWITCLLLVNQPHHIIEFHEVAEGSIGILGWVRVGCLQWGVVGLWRQQ